MYYDMAILRHNTLFNFVVGNRGAGKTYGCKKWCINDFIKNKKQFVWVRRYKSELKKIKLFFSDIAHEFSDFKLIVKGNVALCNDEVMGYFIPLSTAITEKSNSYPEVNKIIFDEFVIDKGHIRYLTNETESFLELYETVARRRDVKAVFLSNAITVINPYFIYFNIFPNENGNRFTKYDDILIDNFKNEEFVKSKHETRFGKIVKNTNFSRYAIDNEFLRDNDDFVNKTMPKPNTHMGTIKYQNALYGIYWAYNENIMYVKKVKNSNKNVYAITIDEQTPNTILLKSSRIKRLTDFIKDGFQLGVTWYDNIKTKNQFLEIVKILNIY